MATEITSYRHPPADDQQQKPDSRPGPYYVSVIDADRYRLLLGPFDRHADALAKVEPVRVQSEKLDARAVFYGFGTVRVVGHYEPGAFNRLGITV